MFGQRFVLASCVSVLMSACGVDQEADPEWDTGEAAAELAAVTSRVSTAIRTICINGTAYTGNLSTALNLAIINYNALALTFRFARTTGTTTGCDAVIVARVLSGFTTASGFPSGGRPFNSLGVGLSFTVHNVDVLEHLITHLLGHNIGLLHTDSSTSTPVSCAAGQVVIPNFGGGHTLVGGIGGIISPGSPPPTPGGSIMNTCIPASTGGEFTSSDISGLRFFY